MGTSFLVFEGTRRRVPSTQLRVPTLRDLQPIAKYASGATVYTRRPMATRDAEIKERAEARVGATLRDKWHVDSLIGLGGMAAVYEATHRNGKRAAIKILHAEA